jgi:SAM-dependent methyltransferase
MSSDTAAAEFWEQRYREREHPSSGIPNSALAAYAGPLTPGTALDLGCALGDDTNWLAARGWHVTAVDISATALERAAARAAQLGHAERVDVQQHDLAVSFPDGSFDLVCAVHLQSPLDFPREAVVRRAARAVAPGGRLLVSVHGPSPGHDAAHIQHHGRPIPTPAQSLAALQLAPGEWELEISEAHEGEVVRPDGTTARVTDTVVAVHRRGGAAP